jgi:Na+-translocating ferredoxin:NAD+ oxidoreductase RNF subunit RnfB
LVTAIVILSLTGLLCAVILVLAARFFAVHEDPRVEAVAAALPGASCGGCGYAGCGDYAKALVTAGAPCNLCGPGGVGTAKAIAHILGLDHVVTERKVAFVLCGGDRTKAGQKFLYNGVADCKAAHSVDGGDKLCRYGCLGYGSCSRVCPSGAIEIANGLALVHPDLCISCGACVRTCPRGLIKMVPDSRHIHVVCSNRDRGPDVKKVCTVGCIGCTVCTKLAPDQAIKMDGFLAAVDYAKPLETEVVVEKCPGHCIEKR